MNTTANLGKAPVRTLVLQLAIPSMTAQFVNVLYSIIDRMYIGHISENGALALAGAGEYYGAAEPPVRCGESHLSGLTEPPHFVY